MSLPNPQDFEKAEDLFVQYISSAVDSTPPKSWYREIKEEIIEAIAKALADEREKNNSVSRAVDILWDECVKNKAQAFGEWDCSVDGKKFMVRIQLDTLPSYSDLESEKSLLEKSVEVSDNAFADACRKLLKSTERIKALEADNERLKAEVESVKASRRNDPVAVLSDELYSLLNGKHELEARLAEAMGVIVDVKSYCRCLDFESAVMRTHSRIDTFLNSPTTSKALEIARAKDVIISIANDCLKTSFSPSSCLALFKAREALDALTSEEGKV